VGPLFLVVEDNALHARSLVRVLKRFGRTEIAATTAVTRARLAGGGVDALTLDLDLGDGDGLDLLTGMHRTLPAVVIAGLVDRAVLLRAHAAGVHCLQKPLDVRALERFAEGVCAGHRCRMDRIAARIRAWGERYQLSPGELGLLHARIHGMSHADVAEMGGVTRDAVEKRSRALLAKTGDESLNAAVVRLLAESLD
jgi:DNA-binding NarL/FixJ family response regulator